MLGNGEAQKEAIRPDFNRSIFIDFSGAKITLDSSRFWNGMMVFWAFPKQISTLKRENLTENWQMGMRNRVLGKVPHNSD